MVHPQWDELKDAVVSHGGSFIRFIRELFGRCSLPNHFPPDMPIPPSVLQAWAWETCFRHRAALSRGRWDWEDRARGRQRLAPAFGFVVGGAAVACGKTLPAGPRRSRRRSSWRAEAGKAAVVRSGDALA